MYALAKRVFLELRDAGTDYLKRLVFFTTLDNGNPEFKKPDGFRIKNSTESEVGCIVQLTDKNVDPFKNTLACYKTYQEMIQKTNVTEEIGNKVHFEFSGESFEPTLHDITDHLS